ncbi:hypothetical protein KQH60_12100 [Mycetohabitans sp. B8]|uniref:hypothetical protein n=1 Tax=Mycetohabitans sp. B8 TaxID=2841845 RepID=UPI001F355424|nr:hypothetical protein [Mycetohabitans sp. B8]MCG1043238.1 hypothetical protein [Mycetohabitans sp. B8]
MRIALRHHHDMVVKVVEHRGALITGAGQAVHHHPPSIYVAFGLPPLQYLSHACAKSDFLTNGSSRSG